MADDDDKQVKFDVPPADPPVAEEAPDAGDDSGAIEVVNTVFHPPDANKVPTVALPKDHFTLSQPTTTIRYRRATNAARIIEDSDKQYGEIYLEAAGELFIDYDGYDLGTMFSSYSIKFGGPYGSATDRVV